MNNIIERNVYVTKKVPQEIIEYVRGTNLLPILFHFRDFDIPESSIANVFIEKPSGKAVYDEAKISLNDVEVNVKSQMVAEIGHSYMTISIKNGNETLVSFVQDIYVYDNPTLPDDYESENDATFFDEAEEIINKAEEVTGQAQDIVDNLEDKIGSSVANYFKENPINVNVNICTDKTLSQDGVPADAKVTGETLNNKLNNKGFTPNIYLGTDESGNITEKELNIPEPNNDYEKLDNLPILNGIGIKGDKTLKDYGIPIIDYNDNYKKFYGEEDTIIISELSVGIYTSYYGEIKVKGFQDSEEEQKIESVNGMFIIYRKWNDSMTKYDAIGSFIDNDLNLNQIALDNTRTDGMIITNIAFAGDFAHKNYRSEITGEWLFNELPKTEILPTEDSHIANKQYVDETINETVPEWARQASKPTYSAEEVGALSKDTKIPSKTSDLTNDSGFIVEETDPTVPSWAKSPTKPQYTADEINADHAGTAVQKVSEHNVSNESHNDIRLLIQELTNKFNALADSDDETLDQLSEIVSYIKNNKSLIDGITTGKINVSDIIDNLTTNVSNKPLSAAQGVVLKSLIDDIIIPTTLPNPQKLIFTGAIEDQYDGSVEKEINIPESENNYNVLTNKPTLNGVEVSGEKTSEDYKIYKTAFYVNITESSHNGYNSDKTNAEIYQAYIDGAEIIALYDGKPLYVNHNISITENGVYFTGLDGLKTLSIWIQNDSVNGSTNYNQANNMSLGVVKASPATEEDTIPVNIDDDTGFLKVNAQPKDFLVTINSITKEADKTNAEIYQAYTENRNITAKMSAESMIFNLQNATATSAVFNLSNNLSNRKISIDNDIVTTTTTNVIPTSDTYGGIKADATTDTDIVPVKFNSTDGKLYVKEYPSKTSDLENDNHFITDDDIPSSMPNPQKLKFTGVVTGEYDGSTEQTINIPEGMDLEKFIENYYALRRTGKVYQTKLWKFATNPSSTGEKLLDNAGLVFEPSTDSTLGQDDYLNGQNPLFEWVHCNYTRDADGTARPIAIEGMENYKTTGSVDVGAMQMSFWWNWDTSNAEYDLVTISDTPHPELGLKPWCECVKEDGTVLPWCIGSSYISGIASDGLLRSQPGLKPERFQSHNNMITNYQKKGDGYWGAGSCRNTFQIIFNAIKGATKNSQTLFTGITSYSFQYNASIQSSESNTYFPVTNAQAANVLIGNYVSVGYGSNNNGTANNDRGLSTVHAYADDVKVINKVALDDGINTAIYLDIPEESAFNTMPHVYTEDFSAPIIMSSMHSWSGTTDVVLGHHDGSPMSNTDSKHAYRVQGREYAIGTYNIASDTVAYLKEDGTRDIYYAEKGTAHSSAQSVILESYKKVGTIPAYGNNAVADGYVGDFGIDAESGVWYPGNKGSGSSQGVGDYLYAGGTASDTLREYLQGGVLGFGAGAGAGCLYLWGALSSGGWFCAACD